MTTPRSAPATPARTPSVPREAIAIVGIGGLFPGSLDIAQFWNHILRGTDLITDVPSTHWSVGSFYDADPRTPDKTYAKRGGFLPAVSFDTLAMGIPPNLLPSTDTSQLLGLLVAKSTLDEVFSGDLEGADKSRVSCILGVTSGQELFGQMAARLQHPHWEAGMRAAGIDDAAVKRASKLISDSMVPWTEATFPGLLGNVVAGRIANRLNLGGTNAVTDAACASSFAALSMGIDELHLGRADVVLTGGVDTLNDIFMHMCFSKTPALSPTGDCRPFDARGDGTLLGEGLGMVALKRKSDAERDGNVIYALITGVGTSSDGKSKSVYAPVPQGQAQALRRAYQAAGYSPRTVELVEAHGTGTKAGDVAELQGLKLAFGEAAPEDAQWCAVGTVKSQIGHTKAAAGAAGLLKAALALHHKVLPPTIKVDTPNPGAELHTSPFYVNSTARPWVRGSDHPRRASVSSFGFGGSNFHIALEEYRGTNKAVPAPLSERDVEIFALSAASPQALRARALQEHDALLHTRGGPRTLGQIAATLNAGFDAAQPARALFVVADVQDALAHLFACASEQTLPGLFVGTGAKDGKLALVFPGQGSQRTEMASALCIAIPAARAVFDSAADVALGFSLKDAVFPPPAFDDVTRRAHQQALAATECAQPALGAASLATLAALRSFGIDGDLFAGHSFGELTALCAGGAMEPSTLLTLARARGLAMKDAATGHGAMAAVLSSADTVARVLRTLPGAVVIANENAPEQTVVSGPTADVDAACAAFAAHKIQTKKLDVSSAFHSPVVAGATEALRRTLANVAMRAPARPVFANTTAAPHGDVASIKAELAAQVSSRVRFVDEIRAMVDAGATTFVEVGPGKALCGLIARIDPRARVIATDDANASARGTLPTLRPFFLALCRLGAAGYPVDLRSLAVAGAARVPAHTKTSVMLTGSNAGKPALPAPAPAPARAASAGTAASPVAIVRDAPRAAPAPMTSKPAALGSASPPSIRSAPSRAEVRPMTQPTPPLPHDVWLDVFKDGQRHALDAHLQFQQTLAAAHASYLQTMEGTQQALLAALGGPGEQMARRPHATPTPAPMIGGAAAALASRPVATAAVAAARVALPPAAIPSAARPAPNGHLHNGAANGSANGHSNGHAETAPVPQRGAPSSNGSTSLQSVLLDIVAEKTGYPKDALQMEMSLEADLGIDSIKRVEILGALKEKAPEAAALDPLKLAQATTLGGIAALLGTPSAAQAAPAPAAPMPAPGASRSGRGSVRDILLDVVAEKTGYPKDALDDSMSLEADLGIDSIKRVEILGALKERAPATASLDALKLAQLRTLGEISLALDTRPQGGAAASPFELAGGASRAAGVLSASAFTPALKDVDTLSAQGPRVPRLVVQHVARAAQAHARQLAAPGALVVIVSGGTTGEATANALAPVLVRRGFNVQMQRLVDCLAAGSFSVGSQANAGAAGVVDVSALDCSSEAEATQGLKDAVFLAQQAENPLLLHAGTGAFFVAVTARAASDASAIAGARSGIIKTAALEWPAVRCCCIDVSPASDVLPSAVPTAVCAAILAELDAGLPDTEVQFVGDTRRVLAVVAAALPPSAPRLHKGSVVLASGGARGVTATTLRALAEQAQPRIVLLGRTDLEAAEAAACVGATDEAGLKRILLESARASGKPLNLPAVAEEARQILARREIRQFLADLAARGSDALYFCVDVRDTANLRTALATARAKFGPFTALLHGAGVLADKRISDKTREQVDRVVDTKVAGLLALLGATSADPLDVIALFSSVAGVFGNVGQVDYAAANEALSFLAAREAAKRPHALVKSFCFGPWEGGMVTPALKAAFRARGVQVLSHDDGARHVVDELSTGSDSAVQPVFGGELSASSTATAPSDSRGAPAAQHVAVHINATDDPAILDHAIGGIPVLPAVFAVERCVRAAQRLFPQRTFTGVNDVRVLRGVRLPNLEADGHVLDVELETLPDVQRTNSGASHQAEGIRAVLRSPQQQAPHYTMTLTEVAKAAPRHDDSMPSGAAPFDAHAAYRDLLFHGPAIAAIRSIDAASTTAMVFSLRTQQAFAWGATAAAAYVLDVALLDGALQAALLFARQGTRGAFLPTSIGEIAILAAHPAGDSVRCVVRGAALASSDVKARVDIDLVDANNQPVYQLRDVELHRLPDDDAFARDPRAFTTASAGEAE